MSHPKIPPGTVAAIAASLMAQGLCLNETSDLWPRKNRIREARIEEFVSLAWDIALETERQNPTNQG